MRELDEWLKQNLISDCVPEERLNAEILKKAKETQTMKHKTTFRSGVAAAATIAILAVGSISAYAAYRYLTPSQVADRMTEDGALAKAFESKDAILVNETQKSAGYEITLMGIVTGKDLSVVVNDENRSGISNKKSYVVTAIAKEDGTPMPGQMDDDYQTFCVSPLIHGKRFVDVNNGTLSAGAQAFVQDGVQYQLLECDNLEIFADMGVYIGVVESFGQEAQAFAMDRTTGDYTVNKSYDGLKALFVLPLDKSKADDAAAKAYFVQNDARENTQTKTDEESIVTDSKQASEESALANEWVQKLTKLGTLSTEEAQEYIRQHAKTLWQETYTPDADNNIHVQSDAEVADYNIKTLPEKTGVETVLAFSSDGTLAGTFGDTIVKNEDGTYTYTVYCPLNYK